MIHTYTRHVWTVDGRKLAEDVTLTGADVARHMSGGRGDRLAFVELVNRWNRAGLLSCNASSPLYLYIAGESVHG